MIGVAAFSGIAVGAGLGLLIRRDRYFQLASLGLLSIALAIAFVLAGAPLPGLGALLLGGLAEVVLLAPSARPEVLADDAGAAFEPRRWGWIAISGAAALAVVGVLIGVGVASRSDLAAAAAATHPTLAQVGHQLVMGTGVAVLMVGLLAATTVVGGRL